MRIGVIRVLFTLALLAAQAAHLRAQPASFDLSAGRQPAVSLDGPWLFHPGDSPPASGAPLWAAPAFDDSAWKPLSGARSWSTQGFPGMSGYAWYRFRIQIPAGQPPTDLLFAPILTAYELYVDGHRVGGVGAIPPSLVPNADYVYHQFPLTRDVARAPRTVLVALRIWHAPIWSGYVGGGPSQGGHLAGAPALLATELHHHMLARAVIFVDQYAYSIAAGLVGLVILWLYLSRPAEREYLWFAVLLLAQTGDCVLAISRQIWSAPPIPLYDLADGILVAIAIVAIFCFLSRVLNAPIGRPGRVLLTLAAISPFMAILYWPGWLSTAASAALQLACALPAIAWILVLLIRRSLRGNTDARLLLAPILLAQGFFVAYNLAVLLAQAGFTPWPTWLEEPLPLPPFTIHLQIFFNLIFLTSLLAFLILRFTRARRREVHHAAELAAAREIQDVLLPTQNDQSPGFHVDFVYRPAEEVGGDFFQQVADGHGGLLVVVGDVSGKGLPAAMLVAALVGAIRAHAAHSADPAGLLACLNDRLLTRQHGGLVTCLAAHISAAGRLTIANAGHLPPYRNGRELDITGSLPLGLLAGVAYCTATFDLAPGDRLAFVSDGVPEAQTRSGELFGFDRTRALTLQPADTIAQAAQDFGQQDDISIVTLDFAGI
jgi:phosphoserine phosphatase RsbU/P